MSDPIPAATLVLFRDGPQGVEHLFVERSKAMAFAGGATVFPGGRVDPGDRVLAARFPTIDPDDAAGRIAAIRETIEECGVAVGLIGQPDVAVLRQGLADGRDFGALLEEIDVALDLSALTPFARWCPNFPEARTFDTRFYVARALDDSALASVDATENVDLFWATASEVLSRADDEQLRVIFPTKRNLERLAGFASFDAARAHTAQHPIELITPWIEERDGKRHLCIPQGIGYPITSQPLDAVFRG